LWERLQDAAFPTGGRDGARAGARFWERPADPVTLTSSEVEAIYEFVEWSQHARHRLRQAEEWRKLLQRVEEAAEKPGGSKLRVLLGWRSDNKRTRDRSYPDRFVDDFILAYRSQLGDRGFSLSDYGIEAANGERSLEGDAFRAALDLFWRPHHFASANAARKWLTREREAARKWLRQNPRRPDEDDWMRRERWAMQERVGFLGPVPPGRPRKSRQKPT
jgi:hypothetical protein